MSHRALPNFTTTINDLSNVVRNTRSVRNCDDPTYEDFVEILLKRVRLFTDQAIVLADSDFSQLCRRSSRPGYSIRIAFEHTQSAKESLIKAREILKPERKLYRKSLERQRRKLRENLQKLGKTAFSQINADKGVEDHIVQQHATMLIEMFSPRCRRAVTRPRLAL